MSIKYSLELKEQELHDVRFYIPLGTSANPNIINIDGSYRHNLSAGELVWELSIVDSSNSSGSLEFSIQQKDSDAFFPILAYFSSKKLYCNIDVQEVVVVSSNSQAVFGLTKSMSSEEYMVV